MSLFIDCKVRDLMIIVTNYLGVKIQMYNNSRNWEEISKYAMVSETTPCESTDNFMLFLVMNKQKNVY